jgi:hypothetical protein
VNIEPTIMNQNVVTTTIKGNAIQGPEDQYNFATDDLPEQEIDLAGMEQVLAQCYRIARERARQLHLLHSQSSTRTETGN